MYRILIVEDDPTIAAALADALCQWNMEPRRVQDFRNVLAEFSDFAPHLVLMDISLPFCDGYHWCSQIRKSSRVPIVFLSSASDNLNIIMAIQAGADDFIAKPFDLGVFNAKVQALLRRTYEFADSAACLSCGDVRLNLSDATVCCGSAHGELTRNELRILQVLMENQGHVVSRDALMERLWETDCFVDENTLTVNIARLRRKLASLGATDLIHTRKGVGYLIEAPRA